MISHRVDRRNCRCGFPLDVRRENFEVQQGYGRRAPGWGVASGVKFQNMKKIIVDRGHIYAYKPVALDFFGSTERARCRQEE